jgi:hypothetical protein
MKQILKFLSVFVLQVSHVQDLFEALLEYESDIMAGNFTPSDIINIIASVNSILEVCFYFLIHSSDQP